MLISSAFLMTSILTLNFGGGGGNRTPVQKPSHIRCLQFILLNQFKYVTINKQSFAYRFLIDFHEYSQNILYPYLTGYVTDSKGVSADRSAFASLCRLLSESVIVLFPDICLCITFANDCA